MAPTPTRSVLSNGTSCLSELGGQPDQQHDSSSSQNTVTGRRRRRRLLTEPINGRENRVGDDQPCGSGMQSNYVQQHLLHREINPGIATASLAGPCRLLFSVCM